MGAHTNHGILSDEESQFIQRTLDSCVKEGFPFKGVLYTGVLITASGPKVLEYNCRFGDPETQVLMALFRDDCDLYEVMQKCVTGQLSEVKEKNVLSESRGCTVVLASSGYPGS